MRLSESGAKLLKSLEGFSLVAYPDGKNPDGSPRYSIGYGHNGVKQGDRITQAVAEQLFLSDVQRFERAVSELLTAPTTQGQFDALVAFAYNVGEGATGLAGSTLLQFHNDGHFQEALAEFPRWIHSAGVVDPRLVERRRREAELYAASVPPVVAPPELPAIEHANLAGVGLIFFCPSCGGRCAATLVVKRAS